MAEFKSYIIANWSIVANYAMMLVGYFLVFLFKNKVNGTAQNLNLAFTQLKDKFSENTEEAKKHLDVSIKKYQEAVATISDLTRKVQRLEETLLILLGDSDIEETEVKDDVQHEK